MSAGTPTSAPVGGKYQPGDRCFTKLKGWPWWPSKIKERIPGKVEAYKVYFYGTYDEGTVKLDQMMEYNEENYEKLSKKPSRNAKFPQGMKEIEQNMEIVDHNAVAQNSEEANEGEDDGELLIDEGPPVLTKEAKTPKQIAAQKKNARAVSPDMAEEKPKPTPKKGGRGAKSATSTPAAADATEPVTTPLEPAGPPQPEIVSRSGRKIKPKRFADDFDTGTKADPSAETPPASKRAKRASSVGNKIPAPEDGEAIAASVEAAEAPSGKRKSTSRAPSTSTPRPPPLTPKTQQKSATKATPTTAASRGPPPLIKGKPDTKKQPGKANAAARLEDLQSGEELNDEEAPILEDARLPQTNEMPNDQEVEDEDIEESTGQVKEPSYKFTNGNVLVEVTGDGEYDEDIAFDEDQEDTSNKIPMEGDNGIEVQVRVGTSAKENIKSQKGKASFDRTTKKNLDTMKTELEKSESSANEFLKSVVTNVGPKDEELNSYTVAKLKENVQQKVQVLRTEGELIELIAELVTTLSIKSADPDKALDLLERIGNTKVDTFMLKKHAEVVDTIRQLRNYEGNVDEWSFTREQNAEFAKKAELIRNKSESIYQAFKSLFCSNAQNPFQVAVTESIKTLNAATEDSPLKTVFGLVKDPSESEAAVSGNNNNDIKEESIEKTEEHKHETAETQPMEEGIDQLIAGDGEGEPDPGPTDSADTNEANPASTDEPASPDAAAAD